MKRKRLIISVLLFGILLMLSKPFFQIFRNTDTIINKIGCRIYELNNITINIEDNIDLNSIQVMHNSRIVYENGKQRRKIKVEYGYCVLKVYYKNDLLSEIGHFKTNNWFTNDYFLTLIKSKDNIDLQFRIDGPNNDYEAFKKQYKRDVNNKIVKIEYYNESDSLINQEIVR